MKLKGDHYPYVNKTNNNHTHTQTHTHTHTHTHTQRERERNEEEEESTIDTVHIIYQKRILWATVRISCTAICQASQMAWCYPQLFPLFVFLFVLIMWHEYTLLVQNMIQRNRVCSVQGSWDFDVFFIFYRTSSPLKKHCFWIQLKISGISIESKFLIYFDI